MWGIVGAFILQRLRKAAVPLILAGLLVASLVYASHRHSVWVEGEREEAREEVREELRKFDETRAEEIRARVRAVPRPSPGPKRVYAVPEGDTRGYRD